MLKGTITVIGDSTNLELDRGGEDGKCVGVRELRSLRVGGEVVVFDADGDEVGRTTIASSEATRRGRETRICTMTFLVIDLPESPSYRFQITPFYEVTVSFDDLASRSWLLGITIGPST